MSAGKTIIDYFPLATPRPGQIKILSAIQDRLSNAFDNIILSAPTGTGKSAIGLTAALWAREAFQDSGYAPGAYYLVTQKMLQDQLQRDGASLGWRCASVKSAEAYTCTKYGNCGTGRRISMSKSEGYRCGTCPYVDARTAFENATIGVTNYAYLMSCLLYTDKISPRQMLIADECHSVEDQVIRFADATVTTEHLKKWAPQEIWPRVKTMSEYRNWLGTTYIVAARETYKMMLEVEAATDQPNPDSEVAELDKHICKLNRALDLTASVTEQKKWVFWEDVDEDDRQFVLRPIFGADHTNLLFSAGDAKVFMSASPGPKNVFCSSLGLDPSRTAYLSIASEFPVENRKVIFKPMGSMGSTGKNDTLPVVLRCIQKIASAHVGQRGLIHCASYELGGKIVDSLNCCGQGHRVIFPKSADEREEAFKKHAMLEGSIIISPSMIEGFDFAGDLARWQIIPKVCWGFLGDKQIEARRNLDPEWYTMKAAIATIQACGRVCRSSSDWGHTYILDSDFGRLLDNHSAMFPNWFVQAIKR